MVSRSQLSKETKFTTERRMPASPTHVFTLYSLKSFELLEIGLKTGCFIQPAALRSWVHAAHGAITHSFGGKSRDGVSIFTSLSLWNNLPGEHHTGTIPWNGANSPLLVLLLLTWCRMVVYHLNEYRSLEEFVFFCSGSTIYRIVEISCISRLGCHS